MSTKSFVWTLIYCMVAGSVFGVVIGGIVGLNLPDAFPNTDPFRRSPVNVGIVYGLAYGLTLGMVAAMFYIWWKSWAIKNMIYAWKNGDDPEGNWLEWRPSVVHILGSVMLVPIAALAILLIYGQSTVDRVPLRAYGGEDGLTIRYLGFRAITVVGAYRVGESSEVYTLKYPRLYRNKGTCHCEEVIPWKQLQPVSSDQKAPANDGSRWELLYTKCEDTRVK